MKQPPIISEYQQRPSRFPLWWVLGVNLAVVLLTIQFYWVPKGMGIRPMGWTAWMFMLTFAGLVGIPIAQTIVLAQVSCDWFAFSISDSHAAFFPCSASARIYFRAMIHRSNKSRGCVKTRGREKISLPFDL
jgi:hypothetical protein